MRREFIFGLLGFVSVSTISSLLSGSTQLDPDKQLLDWEVGVVEAGNFTYWMSGYPGYGLIIELTSLTGDADLYVGDMLRPGYEPEKNNFSSITCGPDMVHVPASFPRPVGIGVFGHWSHQLSEYSIQVFWDTSAVLSEHQMRLMDKMNGVVVEQETKVREKPVPRKADEQPKTRFLKFISFLDMVFEMFVL